MSPILVMLMLHSDSNFERSNISFKEDELDGVDPNSTIAFEIKKNSTVFGRLNRQLQKRLRIRGDLTFM